MRNAGELDFLQELNRQLATYDLHFGYRVLDEIMQFWAVAQRLAEQSGPFELRTGFDMAILMKVLPKFNGPRNRLRQPLEVVVAWAKKPDRAERKDVADHLKDASACRKLLGHLENEFVYPETARKAIRMLIRLHETGFASFA